jgi:glycosyltransferase involved in cell wall biosynthesis
VRLGVVHWAFPPIGGGVETHLLTVCPEMVRQGLEVYLITATVKGEKVKEYFRGIHIQRCDGLDLDILLTKSRKGEDIYQASKKVFSDFIDLNKIDCIQAHNLHLDVFELSRALLDVCQSRNVPAYLVIHNERFYDRQEELMWQILRLPWAKLVPVSQYIYRSLKEKAGFSEQKWKVVLHGIDLEQFNPLDEEKREKLKESYGFKGRRVIVLPARILPSKGCLEAIKGMKIVSDRFPDALLVLTGGVKVIFDQTELTKYYNKLRKTIEENGLEKNVFVASDYSYQDIPRLCALSEIVTYPTVNINEPFGLGPVEGMASGRPVVVTNSGGLIESVIDGVTGLVIDKQADKIPSQWSEKVIYLLSNPQLASKMGQKGRKRAEELFDKKRMARDFIELSRELVKKK